MPDRFVSPAAFAPTRLIEDAPLGLFCGIGDQPDIFVWVLEHSAVRYGVVLISPEEKMPYYCFPLSKDTWAWFGVSFGSVTVEVDPSSAIREPFAGITPGMVAIGKGKVWFGAKDPHSLRTIHFEVGACGASSASELVAFSRWRLVQQSGNDIMFAFIEGAPDGARVI